MITELLSPAGSLKNMRYAFAYGADAVYAGQPRYSLRVRNNEFNHENLKIGIDEAHALGKKFYVVANIQPHNSKLKNFIRDIEPIIAMQPDALIMSDPGLIMMVREHFPDMPIHLSVQANAINWATVKFWKDNDIFKKNIEVGDIVEVSGYPFVTGQGELSLHVDSLKILTKGASKYSLSLNNTFIYSDHSRGLKIEPEAKVLDITSNDYSNKYTVKTDNLQVKSNAEIKNLRIGDILLEENTLTKGLSVWTDNSKSIIDFKSKVTLNSANITTTSIQTGTVDDLTSNKVSIGNVEFKKDYDGNTSISRKLTENNQAIIKSTVDRKSVV